MPQKTVHKKVMLASTVLMALAIVTNASLLQDQDPLSVHQEFNLGVEKFQDVPASEDSATLGKKLYAEAVRLLEASPIKAEERVYVKRQSSLARNLLSDELEKQKGVLPTALRLVTQGFMSFFTPSPTTSTTTSSSSSSTTTESDGQPEAAKSPKHRDPMVAKAIELLKTAGYDHDNDDALWTLANIHFHGQYKAKRDLLQAFDMYAALADRSGNSTAQHMVGFMYSTGLGNVVERDEARAMLYTTFAALANNTAAELTLGYKYMLGIGTKKSCEDSVWYYKRAADKAHAMYLSGPPLGRTMPPIKARLTDADGGTYGAGASGPGSPQRLDLASDIQDFIEFHRYIAENDSSAARAAQFQLGILYYTGNAGTTTIQREFEKAGYYLRKVADHFFNSKTTTHAAILEAIEQKPTDVEPAGIAAALLGKMYWRGEGFEVNEALAFQWFTKGAALSNPVALNGLGTMYLNGAAGLPIDAVKAKEYFKKAAELNYPDAKVNMGLIYLKDPKTHGLALLQFEEAVNAQNFQAAYHLGEMRHYGLGAPKNCEMATRYFKYVAERGDWGDDLFLTSHKAFKNGDVEYASIGYLQAAERGFEIGQSNFAWILDRELPASHYLTTLTSPSKSAVSAIEESSLVSLGSPNRLLEMALIYWTRSANQGDVDARVKMGDYYFTGIGTEVDYTKARACYQVAAEAEMSAMAMWNLGWMHENGIGVAKDFHLAKRWYDMSLTTNPGAVLPVTLSLAKLNARYIWNYLTGGEIGGSTGSFWSISGKPTASNKAGSKSSRVNVDEKGATQAGDKRGTGGEGAGSGANTWDFEGIADSGIEKWKNQKNAAPSEDGADGFGDPNDPENYYTSGQKQQQQPQEGDELEEDDLVEGLVIIGLCMVVGYLMYVRQFRFAGNNNNNNQNNNQNNGNGNRNGNGNNNQGQNPGADGLPGDPNAAGRFAYYAAGG